MHSDLFFRKWYLLNGVAGGLLVRELVIVCRKLLDCIKSVRQGRWGPCEGPTLNHQDPDQREK